MTLALIRGTASTKPAFAEAFKRLCLSFNAEVTPEKADAYWSALSDVSVEALQEAVAALQKEPGRKWFPTTGEWREAANAALERRLRQAVHSPREEPWRLECTACEDTGWTLHECDASPCLCGRTRKHAPHSYSRVCHCRPTNRTYIRTRAYGAGAT